MSFRIFIKQASWVLILAFILAGPAQVARADSDRQTYFYHGFDYGSQSIFNPLTLLLNRGWDVLQARVNERDIFAMEYADNAKNVAKNLFVRPWASVREQGFGRFWTTEIMPVGYTRRSARWTPNYSLHLLGGGMTYTALREWYEAHQLNRVASMILSASTVLAADFINETIENKGVMGRNTDAIADWYFFDIAGLLLFSFEKVNRFFSQQLVLADWSLQPTFTFPGHELHNVGNYFMAKYALPFYPRLSLFSYFGMVTTGGLSFNLKSSYSLSAAGGTKFTRMRGESAGAVNNTVDYAPFGGVFLDRNNSLLASVQYSPIRDYWLSINIYPNAFWRSRPAFGLWTVINREGAIVAGASLAWPLGIGLGYSGW